MLLPDVSAKTARQRLDAIVQQITNTAFEFVNQTGINILRFTPVIGYCMFEDSNTPSQLLQQTQKALLNAATLLDLQPNRYDPAQALAGKEGKEAKVQDFVSNIFQRLQFFIHAFLVIILGG